MSANRHMNGGILMRPLRLPDYRPYAVAVPEPGGTDAEATRVTGGFLRDAMRLKLTFVACFAAIASVWLIYALQDIDAFRDQMNAQLLRKRLLAPPYWTQFVIAKAHAVTLMFVVVTLLGIGLAHGADRVERPSRLECSGS